MSLIGDVQSAYENHPILTMIILGVIVVLSIILLVIIDMGIESFQSWVNSLL